MSIRSLIKKHPLLYYWGRVLQNSRNPEFRQSVIDIIEHPALAKVERLGLKNKDKLFYVIDIDDEGAHSGFFSLLNGTIKRLELADRLGAIPYIRWINTSYGNSNEKSNTFDSFFFQPSNIKYEEVITSQNVIISKQQDGFEREDSQVYSEKSGYLEQMARLYEKYIHLNSDIIAKIEEDRNRLGKIDFNHTIGVHVRGTDYRQSIKGHPKSIMYEEYVAKVDSYLKDNPGWKVFLATDDEGAIDFFCKKYGENIFIFSDAFRGDSNLGIHYMNSNRDNHAFRLGYEVLRDVDTLSRCSVLVAGVSFVSFTAREMKESRNEKYSEINIINAGVNKKGITSAKFNREFNKKRKNN